MRDVLSQGLLETDLGYFSSSGCSKSLSLWVAHKHQLRKQKQTHKLSLENIPKEVLLLLSTLGLHLLLRPQRLSLICGPGLGFPWAFSSLLGLLWLFLGPLPLSWSIGLFSSVLVKPQLSPNDQEKGGIWTAPALGLPRSALFHTVIDFSSPPLAPGPAQRRRWGLQSQWWSGLLSLIRNWLPCMLSFKLGKVSAHLRFFPWLLCLR